MLSLDPLRTPPCPSLRLVLGSLKFNTMQEQESLVRDWIEADANMPYAAQNLGILFYRGKYVQAFGVTLAP